ncbi:hypothetical protein L5515_019583 [Caenorhabditis briggsae]|uniref:Uncharacterized protein n=1 Tax=Caenorhabditis briggsae TaxID=6238 RepID=A0AAE9FJA7_CAEBR|nr:hypothetical protein L5515_019583 [Caenorhabditis briggsae]
MDDLGQAKFIIKIYDNGNAEQSVEQIVKALEKSGNAVAEILEMKPNGKSSGGSNLEDIYRTRDYSIHGEHMVESAQEGDTPSRTVGTVQVLEDSVDNDLDFLKACEKSDLFVMGSSSQNLYFAANGATNEAVYQPGSTICSEEFFQPPSRCNQDFEIKGIDMEEEFALEDSLGMGPYPQNQRQLGSATRIREFNRLDLAAYDGFEGFDTSGPFSFTNNPNLSCGRATCQQQKQFRTLKKRRVLYCTPPTTNLCLKLSGKAKKNAGTSTFICQLCSNTFHGPMEKLKYHAHYHCINKCYCNYCGKTCASPEIAIEHHLDTMASQK